MILTKRNETKQKTFGENKKEKKTHQVLIFFFLHSVCVPNDLTSIPRIYYINSKDNKKEYIDILLCWSSMRSE